MVRIRNRGILALLLALTLALAGCGESEPPAQSTQPESAPEPVAAVAEAEPCELTVGWDPWEPYHFHGAGVEVQGLDIDIVTAVADRADCTLEFEQGNWAALLDLLRAGELDLVLGATRLPQREEFAYFTEPYRQDSFHLFVLADEEERYAGRSLEDLLDDGFRLGVTQGYYYGEELEALRDSSTYEDQILEAAVGELNFTRLLDYQIDGFLEDPFVAAAIKRRRRDADPVTMLETEVGSGPVAFMFSRNSVDESTVEAFDAALAELRASGEHERMLQRYLE
ncbi:MAG: transporter substrate-binding domain-containing protein [Wenzhouxiangellaceae bacterium]|nr:transporter substrate-binding domain-containing protein [Wenzhouxiangellaceae bacterium]